jgi:hypothetical protein
MCRPWKSEVLMAVMWKKYKVIPCYFQVLLHELHVKMLNDFYRQEHGIRISNMEKSWKMEGATRTGCRCLSCHSFQLCTVHSLLSVLSLTTLKCQPFPPFSLSLSVLALFVSFFQHKTEMTIKSIGPTWETARRFPLLVSLYCEFLMHQLPCKNGMIKTDFHATTEQLGPAQSHTDDWWQQK